MKKFLLTAVLFCSIVLSGFAQDNTEVQKADGSRIETLKIAYITQKLNLTTEEAEKFWPVYNKYMEEIRGARQSYQSDKDELKLEETTLNIRKKYSTDFNKALSPSKVNLFFRSEKEFGAIVQKTLNERRQQRVQQRRQLLRQ
jgi:Skp family chaperone for outer membrane proteins